jgi:hypothetical protein
MQLLQQVLIQKVALFLAWGSLGLH